MHTAIEPLDQSSIQTLPRCHTLLLLIFSSYSSSCSPPQRQDAQQQVPTIQAQQQEHNTATVSPLFLDRLLILFNNDINTVLSILEEAEAMPSILHRIINFIKDGFLARDIIQFPTLKILIQERFSLLSRLEECQREMIYTKFHSLSSINEELTRLILLEMRNLSGDSSSCNKLWSESTERLFKYFNDYYSAFFSNRRVQIFYDAYILLGLINTISNLCCLDYPIDAPPICQDTEQVDLDSLCSQVFNIEIPYPLGRCNRCQKSIEEMLRCKTHLQDIFFQYYVVIQYLRISLSILQDLRWFFKNIEKRIQYNCSVFF